MNRIVIGFSSPKQFKIGAEAIKYWCGTPYSHVLVSWKSDRIDRTLVYHASHGSVHFNSAQTFCDENDIVKSYELNITEDQYIKLVAKCVDLAGIEYSRIELIKIFIKDIGDRLGFNIQGFQNSKGYVCSELLGELLIDLGVSFDRPTFLLRPDHIEKALLQMLKELE